jgi:hypothetical protein
MIDIEPTYLQYLGAGLAMIVGFTGLLNPRKMARGVGLSYTNKVGYIEIRVLFGSFLVALPLYAVWQNKAELFVFFGIAALAAAIIKSSFTLIDQCPLKDIWFGILVDVVLAFCLLSPVFL